MVFVFLPPRPQFAILLSMTHAEWKVGDIPFKVDRSAPGSLTKQMANGLREAIASGRFKAGDLFPQVATVDRNDFCVCPQD